MNQLVTFLSQGEHPVHVSLRPEKSLKLFKDCVERKYVHLKFTDTRGGTELGVQIDEARSDLHALRATDPEGEVTFVGDLVLDYVPVTCRARINVKTLEGSGRLELRKKS